MAATRSTSSSERGAAKPGGAVTGTKTGIGRLLVTLGLAACVAGVHEQMDTRSAAESGRLVTPEPSRIRAFALGFEPLIADYYWIQALQVVGNPAWKHGDNEQLIELVDLVVGVDPWVDHPYRFGALWFDRTRDEVRYANALLEQAIAYHPAEWRNRFYLGYNHFFHLGENQQAAEVLESALAFEQAPDYLGALVTRLKANSGGLDAAVIFLQQLVATSEDEYAKAEYGKAFDEIETERRARFLDGARQEFRRRQGRDIEVVSELWEGPQRVIERAPPPHPQFEGFVWELEAETGEIVSSAYGSRYRLNFQASDLEKQRRWDEEDRKKEREAST